MVDGPSRHQRRPTPPSRHPRIGEPTRAARWAATRFRAHTIRARVSRLARVPLALAVALVVVLSINIWSSIKLELIVSGVRDASLPAVRALTQIQVERLRAMAYVSQRSPAQQTAADLHAQEATTDQALAVLNAAVIVLN